MKKFDVTGTNRAVEINHSGFTLAEVLITLGIIGVVAAMTIPTLVQSYKERATVTKVKKAYAMLTNAFQMAILENGTVNNWNLTGVYQDENDMTQISKEGSARFAQIMSKYFKTIKICGGNIDCVGGYDYLLLNGDEVTETAQGSSAILLSDGTGLTFTPHNPELCGDSSIACGSIGIRINLHEKMHFGVNMFSLTVFKDRLIAWGSQSLPDNYSINSFEAKCKYNGGNFENGLACLGWILEVGNMDYLHCDGLSYDGKHECD